MVLVGTDFKFHMANQTFCKMTGYTEEELLQLTFSEITHPDHSANDIQQVKKLIEGKIDVYKTEKRYLKKDGQIFWAQLTVSPVSDSNGGFLYNVAIIIDITERKRADQALQESEENLSLTLHSIGDGVISTDINGLILNMNPVAEELCGWKLSDAAGKPLPEVFKIINAETRQTVADPVKKVLEKGEKVGLANHTVLVSRNGNEYQIADSAAPIKSKEGKISGVVLVFSDVSEKYAAQKQINESEEKYRKAFQSSSDSVNINKLDGTYVDINEGFTILTGYTREEVIGNTSIDIDIWADPKDRKKLIAGLLENNSVSNLEANFRCKDGSVKTALMSATFIYLNDEQHILSITRDITERKATEFDLLQAKERAETNEEIQRLQNEKIEFHNQRLESLLKISQFQTHSIQELLDLALSEAITLTKSKIGYIYFYNEINKQFELNTRPKEVMDECMVMNPQTIYDLDNTGCWGEAVRQRKPIIINDYQAENPYKKGTPFGHAKLQKFLTIPVFSDNKLVAVAGVANKETDYDITDVTQLILLMDSVWKISERILLIKDLTIAKERAEKSDRLKSAFLANMSHEIRTPMNGILGFAELLKMPGLSGEEQQDYIRIIEKSGARMLNIINDIVNISKIEAGLMTVNMQKTNINEQIDFIYTFFKPEVEGKGMRLSSRNTLPSEEAFIKTDREKLYAILTNLVKNSIKYSEKGSIEFGYVKKGDFLEFFVKDTGIGIPIHRHEAIFERFIQSDINDKKAYQGAGLGLSITKAYIEMLGGKIWVESQELIGSTFYFTLPYNAESEKKMNVDQRTILDKNDFVKKLKILIAEDDNVSELLLTQAIKKYTKELLKAKTGIEAVEACKNNTGIDLVLMDIQMPDLDGYEATKQIREFNKEVVIIAQTAFALEGDKKKAIDAGCNDYISKPIERTLLKTLIQKYFENNLA